MPAGRLAGANERQGLDPKVKQARERPEASETRRAKANARMAAAKTETSCESLHALASGSKKRGEHQCPMAGLERKRSAAVESFHHE